jgi:hypothetical protein
MLRWSRVSGHTVKENLEFLPAPFAREVRRRVERYSYLRALQSIRKLASPNCPSLDTGLVEEADADSGDCHLHRTSALRSSMNFFMPLRKGS